MSAPESTLSAYMEAKTAERAAYKRFMEAPHGSRGRPDKRFDWELSRTERDTAARRVAEFMLRKHPQ